MVCGKLFNKEMTKVRRRHPTWSLTRRRKYAHSVAYRKRGR